MIVRFALVSEGTSEGGLVAHLESLCIRAGAAEAAGSFPDLARFPNPPGRDVESKVRKVVELDPDLDLVFVHRDADGGGADRRLREIAVACTGVAGCPRHVPVVPVQALEAWLLVDEDQIRAVVGRRSGRAPLDLPPLKRIEGTARPKDRLMAALATASEESGRRLQQIRRDFTRHRFVLLQRLDVDGPVTALASWQALVAATEDAVAALRSRR